MGAKKLNYSVCIDAVFRESKLSFVEAMSVIHRLGYKAYEFWSWKDKDIKRIKEVQKETGLKTAAFCTEFINPGDPEKQQEFLEGLKRSMETAHVLDCGRLIVQAGWEYETAAKGITRDQHSREAFDILEKIDSDNVKILFDIYHQQITEGNLYSNIFDHLNQIGHFHAAAVPGRGPITGGEINYTYLLQELADNGYDGYVGLEYMTAFSAEESLKKVMENILV